MTQEIIDSIADDATVSEVPYNQTDTSKMSANQLKPYAGKLGYIIWRHLQSHGEKTCEQIEQDLNMSHQTVSGRLTQLKKGGRIFDTTRRGKNETGRMAIIWQYAKPFQWEMYKALENLPKKTPKEILLEKRVAELEEALNDMHPERIYANPWEIAKKALSGVRLYEELQEQALKEGESDGGA